MYTVFRRLQLGLVPKHCTKTSFHQFKLVTTELQFEPFWTSFFWFSPVLLDHTIKENQFWFRFAQKGAKKPDLTRLLNTTCVGPIQFHSQTITKAMLNHRHM
jgi:hypothetical protein